MIFDFPHEGCTYTRTKAFIDWIQEERFGIEDRGAWMTIEAENYAEAVKKFKRYVSYGRYIGAYV
jgi:hypothetical protein